MAAETAIRALGLMTDPNRIGVAPGALEEALNVVIDRTGTIEPRPGLPFTDQAVFPTVKTSRLAPYLADLISLISDGVFSAAVAERASVSYTGFQTPARKTLHPYEYMLSRGNLYVTGNAGMQKISGLTTNDCHPAGMQRGIPPLATIAIAGTQWLKAGFVCGYRTCFVRTDVNGYVVRGAPSGQTRVSNHVVGPGTNADVSLVVTLPADLGLLAGDVLEVYRGAQVDYTTTEPPDDTNLVISHILTAAEIAALTVTVVDDVVDDFRVTQPVLYSSPSQQGIEQSNETPPWCSDTCFGNRLAFYGDVITRRFALLQAWGAGGPAWDGAHVGRHAAGVTIDVTISNPVAVVAAGHAYVGQCVSQSGTPTTAGAAIPAECIVTAVNGANITLSPAPTATAAGVVCVTFDTVRVGGRNYFASNGTVGASRQFDTTGATTLDDVVARFCWLVNQDPTGGVYAQPNMIGLTSADLVKGFPAVAFYERTLNSTMHSTNIYTVRETVDSTTLVLYGPQDFTPQATSLPTFPDRMLRATLPGGVYISKQDEPEAVPVENLIVVGNAQARVLRMLPVREAVWVFKEDGIFRISGGDVTTIAWNLIDPSVSLLHSYDADVMGDAVIAWTSTGVSMFGDGGAKELSRPFIGATLAPIEEALATRAADQFTQYVVCDSNAGRVLVSVPNVVPGTPGAVTAAGLIYCYSMRTQMWTRWGLVSTAACLDPSIGRVVFTGNRTIAGPAVQRTLVTTRAHVDTFYATDLIESVTVSAVATIVGGFNVTISPDPTLPVLAGDVILDGSLNRIPIVAVVSTGPLVVLTLATPGTGTRTLLHGQTSFVTWLPFDAGGAFGAGKTYREVRMLFDARRYLGTWTTSYSTIDDQQRVDAACTTTYSTTAQSVVERIGVPRDVSRAHLFSVTFLVHNADARFAIDGISPVFSPGAERAVR